MLYKKQRKHKNQLDSSQVASGNDTHIGDNIFVQNDLNYILLGLLFVGLLALGWLFTQSSNWKDKGISPKNTDKDQAIAIPVDTATTKKKTSILKAPIESKNTSTELSKDRSSLPVEPNGTQQLQGNENEKDSKINIEYLVNTSIQADMAILAYGNENKLGLTNNLKNYFQSTGLKTSSAFFKPTFLQSYKQQIETEDLSIYKQHSVSNLINCVCFIEQQISYRESEREGFSFHTTEGNYDIRIFNLHTLDTHTFNIAERGAGGTPTRALQSLEQKFMTLFKQISFNLKSCKT